MLLEPDPFLNELTKLYERNKSNGSVWVTMKRTNLRSRKRKFLPGATDTSSGNPDDYLCLVRATDGKKKISTKVGPKECLRFQAAYSLVQKAHMNALKRKDKREKKKQAQQKPQQPPQQQS